MRIVSDNIKNALKQPTTQRKGRILVNGNYYEVYNVEYYADAYEDGNVIGNAIASQLDFDLPYIDKFNTFKYFDGVWTGNEYEYVDMGTFTVFDEQDEDEFNKHITAFDNLIKFNKSFEEVGTYPKTLYEELQNICQQAGVELVNITIPNGNFQIENNQFVNGETLKTVLKAICQISGNYGIIKEDKLVLQLTNDTDEIILKNQHEPVVWKRKTYGINQVILQLGDVEGEYVIRQDDEDIAVNGVHKLVITNNPFAYTQDKRDTLIDALFNQVRGFGYIPYEMNCEWLNYLEIGDKITIDDIESTVLRIQGKSPKSLESMISAPAIIDSAVEYVNNANSIKNQINRTEIIVDKQNQEIELIASKTEETTNTLKTEKSVESNGEEIYIEDSGGYDLEKLRIDGKSVQETRSGKNLYNATVKQQGGSTNRLNASNFSVLPNTTYTLSTSTNNIQVNNYYKDIDETNISNSTWVSLPYTFTTPENCYYIAQTIRRSDNSDITPSDFINVQLEIGSTATDYEPYGASPSPDYPSEIESVGYSNLFDKDNANILNAYLGSSNISSSSSARVIYIPCYPNTTYTIQKVVGNAFSIAYSENTPNIGTAIIGRINTKSSPTLTITTGANAKYLVSQIMDNGDTLTEEEILNSIQIEEGSVAHSYIPYGKYGIEVKTTGKNLFDGLLELGSFNSSGVSSTNENCVRTVNFTEVKPNATYTISNDLNYQAVVMFYDENKKFLRQTTTNSLNISSEVRYIKWRSSSGNVENNLNVKYMLEEGSEATQYEPYKSNTTVIELNEPLRNLPNGVKDKAYLKNNKLYVDRYVGSVVLNGSESYSVANSLSNNLLLQIEKTNLADLQSVNGIISDHFIGTTGDFIFNANDGKYYIAGNNTNKIRISLNKTNFPTMTSFVNWLETNNVQVDYELATPITEELGFVSIPTFENINHINLYGKISTSFGITYLTNSHLNEQFATKSEIKITNDEINILSKKIQPVSNTIKKTGEIQLENAHEGILHKLVITGNISLNYPSSNNNLYGYSLFPNENLTPKANLTPSIGVPFNHGTLYPSTTLYPKSFKLQVDENVYNLDINYLNYLNSNVYDEFVYEDGNCYIVRRVGIDETGKMYELPSEIFEERKDVLINVLENSKITLLGFDNAILTAEYLLQNQYTDVFATEAYVNSEIKQTADEINIEVAKKVNDDEVVSAINLSPEKISLKSNRLEIDSTYFKLSEDGKIESTSGKIGGFELEKNRLKVTHIPEQSEFTKEDLTIVNDYLKNGKPLSPEQIIKYDFNGDGQVTAVDLLKLQNIVLVKNQNVNIEINSDDFENFINVESDNFGTSFNVSLRGTTINSLTTNDITIKDKNGNTSLNIFENGTILADMTNSEGGAWTIQNFGSQVFTVNKNGQVECVSLTQTSQEKYKKNFEKLENALDIINDTDIYKYNLKTQNNDDKKHIGFVIGDNYKYSEEITSGENEGVDIYSMVSVCFKAIQEQQEQIKMLKNEINQLKEMIK